MLAVPFLPVNVVEKGPQNCQPNSGAMEPTQQQVNFVASTALVSHFDVKKARQSTRGGRWAHGGAAEEAEVVFLAMSAA